MVYPLLGVSLNTHDEVYTVKELAQYLRMKPLTIYKHASLGKLPGFKVGIQWRFKRSTIGEWIEAQENMERDCFVASANLSGD